MKPTHTFNINIEDAQNALTETEFGILTALFNKVENYRIEQEDPIRDILELLTLKGKPINNIYGQPGVGKTKYIEELANLLGFEVVNVKHFQEEKKELSYEDILTGDNPFLDALMVNMFMQNKPPFITENDIINNFTGNKYKFVHKIDELRKKNVPGELLVNLEYEARRNGRDPYEYTIEQERKAREMGVSLTMYLRQQMFN